MYVFWYLMRWMISPSRETYEDIPHWLRPTYSSLSSALQDDHSTDRIQAKPAHDTAYPYARLCHMAKTSGIRCVYAVNARENGLAHGSVSTYQMPMALPHRGSFE